MTLAGADRDNMNMIKVEKKQIHTNMHNFVCGRGIDILDTICVLLRMGIRIVYIWSLHGNNCC